MHLLDHSRLPGFYHTRGWSSPVPTHKAFLIKPLWESSGLDLQAADGPTTDFARGGLEKRRRAMVYNARRPKESLLSVRKLHVQGAGWAMGAALSLDFVIDLLR